MTGPKEEWLIWNMRFQLGFSSLDQRLKKVEERTLQGPQPGQQNDDLKSACSKRLQEDNGGSRNKTQQLEPASDRITQLDEQVQALIASSKQSKEENKVLSDRILQLEQEGTRRDQENELVRQLKAKVAVLEEDFKSVISTIKGMDETNKAERRQRGEEMQQLRSQVGALNGTEHISGRRSRDAAREMFAATTGVEDMLVDEQPKQQQQQQSDAAHRDTEIHGVLIKAQASGTSLEDHLRYAENRFRRHEAEAVHAFVSSLREKYRFRLGNKLEEYGDWTWQAAREESVRILEAENKTTRRSARLMGGSVPPL